MNKDYEKPLTIKLSTSEFTEDLDAATVVSDQGDVTINQCMYR